MKLMDINSIILRCVVAMFIGVSIVSTQALAQEDSSELGKKLANPVAALISVPFQLNYDTDIGPADEGDRWTLNIQPVVPFSLSQDWNLISRTILPVPEANQVMVTLFKVCFSHPRSQRPMAGPGGQVRYSCFRPVQTIC